MFRMKHRVAKIVRVREAIFVRVKSARVANVVVVVGKDDEDKLLGFLFRDHIEMR